jgi:hypothetical protein
VILSTVLTKQLDYEGDDTDADADAEIRLGGLSPSDATIPSTEASVRSGVH